MNEVKNQLTKYGKKVKIELIRKGKKQKWLIEELKKKLPNKYIDGSNLNKILTDKINSPDIISAIDEIVFDN